MRRPAARSDCSRRPPGEGGSTSTMEDVAALCRVSKITVSRAFVAPHLVREQTRNRIFKAAEELGYTYNVLASALRTGSSPFIGIVATVANDSQFRSLIHATQTCAAQSGLQTLLGLTELNPHTELALIDRYIQYRASAIVLYGPTTHLLRENLRRVVSSPSPIVVVGEKINRPDCHCIGYDISETVRVMAEHLLAMGHRRIGLQCGPYTISTRAAARLGGYSAALKAYGLETDPTLIGHTRGGMGKGEDDHMELGYRIAEYMLSLDPRPTAIIFASDPFAAGGILALKNAGLRIPEDMSVCSTMEYQFSSHLTPQLTTTRIDFEKIARHTLDFLHECTQHFPRAILQRQIDTQLVLKASTAPPPNA